MRRLLLACAAVTLLAAQSAEPPRTPEAQAKLDKWLSGRVPGETRTCVPVHVTADPIGIDNFTMLFRDGPRIWRNNLREGNGCGNIGKQTVIVTESSVNRLCNGSRLELYNGDITGACVLGDFTLYKKP